MSSVRGMRVGQQEAAANTTVEVSMTDPRSDYDGGTFEWSKVLGVISENLLIQPIPPVTDITHGDPYALKEWLNRALATSVYLPKTAVKPYMEVSPDPDNKPYVDDDWQEEEISYRTWASMFTPQQIPEHVVRGNEVDDTNTHLVLNGASLMAETVPLIGCGVALRCGYLGLKPDESYTATRSSGLRLLKELMLNEELFERWVDSTGDTKQDNYLETVRLTSTLVEPVMDEDGASKDVKTMQWVFNGVDSQGAGCPFVRAKGGKAIKGFWDNLFPSMWKSTFEDFATNPEAAWADTQY